MKIERLELYGYIRLSGFNIRHLIYEPTSTYQLILGTNGSGKSSVLAELSPLPGHHSMYTKDGYKKIWCSHRGKQYKLESVFKHNKHSFECEGEELNPGGTREVQLNLCWQHFTYSKDIHELLTGQLLFTTMSPAERRKWITMISRTDYTYAMSTFKRISSLARDQQGVLRHLKQRLVNETQTLQSLGDVEGLEEKADALRNELNHLMLERQPDIPLVHKVQEELSNLCHRVQLLYEEYFSNQCDQPKGKRYLSNNDVELDLQRLETNIQSENALLERAGADYHDLEAAINSVHIEAGLTVDDLPGLIEDQLRLIEGLEESTAIFHQLPSPNEIQRDWDAVGDEVQNTFRSLPDNTDRTFSRDAMQALQNELQSLKQQLDKLDRRLRQINSRLDLMDEAQTTQCPSCLYVWKPGYSEDEYRNLQDERAQLARDGEALERVIADRETALEECQNVHGLYRQFRGFIQGYPRLQPLWDYILQNQLLMNNPKGNLGLFQTWSQDLAVNVAREQANRRLEQYREVQAKQGALGDSALFSRRMRALQEEIAQRTQTLLQTKRERGQIQLYFERLQKLQNIANNLESLGNRIETLRDLQVDALRNEIIDQTVHRHQDELAGIVRRLSEKEGQEGIVRDLETSRVKAVEDAETLALLVKAMSPNEGLIAEQLSGDIGCMVAQLNSVISSIWTYDMEVLPCGLSSGELDYRFPVKFSLTGNQSPDVSRTSKGQMQAFNLAFHLTVMLYLGLTDYPLFLDEPGEGFDEQHRLKLMDFVKQLMDSNRHSQLFMISHYASGHGSFSNAQTLVLDASNISIPGTYNQHAVFG